jgi:hypothetical protein
MEGIKEALYSYMAQHRGGNPEPRNMVSAQPLTLSLSLLLLRTFRWILCAHLAKQGISVGLPELCKGGPTAVRDALDPTSLSEDAKTRWSFKGTMPE